MAERSSPPSSSTPPGLPSSRRRVRRHRRTTGWRRVLRSVQRNFKLSVVLSGVAVVLLVILVSQAVLLADAANQLEDSQQNFERVVLSLARKEGTELTLTDFNRLEQSLVELSRSLSRAQARTRLLSQLTGFNTDAALYLDLLDVGQSLASAARDMLSGAEPTLFFLVQGDEEANVVRSLSSGERIVELLTVGRGRFIRAQESLNAARSVLNSADVSGASADTLLLLEEVRGYYDQLDAVNRLLIESPDILTNAFGLEDEAHYLVLAQNSDELRPSGGYIGTWGWITTRNGRVIEYDYSPTTQADPRPPAVDINTVYDLPSWWLQFERPIYAAWDGSWHVDFPSTAQMSLWYYNTGNNQPGPMQGAIAIDVVGFEYLLQGLGSVVMPEYGITVTTDNFREVVYDIRAYGEGPRPHKEFIADLYERIFEEWQNVDRNPDASSSVLGMTLQALREKHIMVYSSDPDTNEALQLLGWNGAQTPAMDHDYLLAADANLGNKANRSVRRDWTYDVQIMADGSLRSRASFSYDYPASVAEQDPAIDPEFHGPLTYGNLLQVFTPVNSIPLQLEEDARIVDVVDLGTHTNFVSLFTVAYDDVARVQFSYEVPDMIESFGPYQRYRLLLQKQPGTIAEQATVQVLLPPDAEILSTVPEPAAIYSLDQTTLDYRLLLETDQWVEIVYR